MNRYGLGWRGALGDTVFELATCARLGQGLAVMPMDRKPLQRLILMQPYIAGIEYVQDDRPAVKRSVKAKLNVTHDIDTPSCIQPWLEKTACDTFIPKFGLRAFGLDERTAYLPWLSVPYGPIVPDHEYAVVTRSLTYHNWRCDWSAAITRIKGRFARVYFVGLPDEHTDFQKEARCEIEHIKTEDALEVAQLIRFASHVACNSSMPLALAIAMGQPHEFEPPIRYTNCILPEGHGQTLLCQ